MNITLESVVGFFTAERELVRAELAAINAILDSNDETLEFGNNRANMLTKKFAAEQLVSRLEDVQIRFMRGL